MRKPNAFAKSKSASPNSKLKLRPRPKPNALSKNALLAERAKPNAFAKSKSKNDWNRPWLSWEEPATPSPASSLDLEPLARKTSSPLRSPKNRAPSRSNKPHHHLAGWSPASTAFPYPSAPIMHCNTAATGLFEIFVENKQRIFFPYVTSDRKALKNCKSG